ncbi:hypothetical protein Tco_1135333 [Tanacetum coccineum]
MITCGLAKMPESPHPIMSFLLAARLRRLDTAGASTQGLFIKSCVEVFAIPLLSWISITSHLPHEAGRLSKWIRLADGATCAQIPTRVKIDRQIDRWRAMVSLETIEGVSCAECGAELRRCKSHLSGKGHRAREWWPSRIEAYKALPGIGARSGWGSGSMAASGLVGIGGTQNRGVRVDGGAEEGQLKRALGAAENS